MKNCINCGNHEYENGKCAFCGTDFGFTGDPIIDKHLLINKRLKYLQGLGYTVEVIYVVDNDKNPCYEFWEVSSTYKSLDYVQPMSHSGSDFSNDHQNYIMESTIKRHNESHPDMPVKSFEEYKNALKISWEKKHKEKCAKWKSNPDMKKEWQAKNGDNFISFRYECGNISEAVEFFLKFHFDNKNSNLVNSLTVAEKS